ncbi:hypothetical protein K1719_004270 [Acacia pycnantha]|nr:hypothetical protein K1719_004270 [Acacia pycnantha]
MAVLRRNLSEQNKKQDGYHHHHQQRRTPSTNPPFTVNQLKKAIPAHCFQRSLLQSSAYLLHDVALSVLIYKSTSFFNLLPHPATASFLLWPLYWLLQGSVLTGIWVVAHECGHQAFSNHQWLNDLIGFFLHSFLLVPYFSWKFSHRRHHANTCSLDNDEAFIPKPKSQIQWYLKYMNNPLGRALTLIGTLTLGWPLYLTFNASGQPYDRFTSHFDPFSPIFSKNERLLVGVSDVGILTVVVVLYKACVAKGLYWVVCVYGVPVMIVNGFLTLITYLNHTHKTVPYYDSSEWDWLRGALSTVDRDYGVLNKVFHNIADTHVAHHLFSTIPHYHAMEATKAIRPILGDYYHYDDTPIYRALWREAKECLYLEPEQEATSSPKGLYWYNNKL